MRLSRWVILTATTAFVAATGTTPRVSAAAAATEAVAAADGFLGTLDTAQRAKATLPLNATTRTVWSNLPTGITMQVGATERNGLKFGSMTAAQRDKALALLAAVLSRQGYRKALDIVNADQRLEDTEGPARPATSKVRFGRAEYYLAVLGTPSPTAPWMVQFGGHHLALNITIAGAASVLTPTHTGAQPATFSMNGETIRPLGRENDKAFALVNALDAAQQKQAVLGYNVPNLVVGPGEDGKTIQPEGLRGSAMSDRQRTMLADLISEWVTILPDPVAAAKMNEVRANLRDTYFAWAGSTSNGQEAYFRVQGPTVIIEYAPQGANNRPSVDHIHTIYRDPTNEYGAKLATP